MSEHPQNISDKDILDVVRSIQFGSVEITIHDNKVVQVERKEKLRSISKNTKPSEKV